MCVRVQDPGEGGYNIAYTHLPSCQRSFQAKGLVWQVWGVIPKGYIMAGVYPSGSRPECLEAGT